MASWTEYLPPTLQVASVYWVMAICFAARMMCASIPDRSRQPWIIQIIVLTVGCAMAILIIPDSRVYAIGTGIIASALTVQCYDLIFTYFEGKLRSWLGITKLQEPLELPPASTITQPMTDKLFK